MALAPASGWEYTFLLPYYVGRCYGEIRSFYCTVVYDTDNAQKGRIREENGMTKSELRKARKQARAEGRALEGPLALPHNDNRTDRMEFSETPRGYEARERWARYYDSLNGAQEGDWDR